MRYKLFGCIAAIFVGLAGASPASGAAPQAPITATAPSGDVGAVARLNGLTLAQAVDFASLQSTVEGIGVSLSNNPAVTSYWIEPANSGMLVVGLRDLTNEGAVIASLPASLQSRVRFVQQRYSELELGIAANEVALSYTKQSVPAYGSVDVRAQSASVTLDNQSASQARIQAHPVTASAGGVPVSVSVGDIPQPASTIYAGLAGSGCTSGFSVEHTSGTRGIITAAHCGNSQTISGVSLTFKFEWQYGSADVQWHTASGSTFRNWAYDGLNDGTTPYYRLITGTIPRLSLVTGGTYCKYGITTKYGCGTLSSRVETPSWVNNASATFLAIDNASAAISLPGDSGGPTFSDGNAVGLVSGTSNSGHRLVSMSMDGFAGLGITVATS
jgi:hypothetical protein